MNKGRYSLISLNAACSKGFTLIEAMLTVAVLAIGLVLLLSSFNAAARRNIAMQEYDTVCSLASKISEELKESPQATFHNGSNGNVSHGDYPGYTTNIHASEETLFTKKGKQAVKGYEIRITVIAPSYNRYYFTTYKMVR